MEFDINDDPMAYEARPIFGYWTRRQSAVGLAVAAGVGAVTAAAWALGLPADVAAGLTFAAGALAGYFALSKRHGLYPEQWMPILDAERKAPRERVWTPPRARIELAEAEEAPSRKQLRRERRERSAELETDDLLCAYLALGALDPDDTETGDSHEPAL